MSSRIHPSSSNAGRRAHHRRRPAPAAADRRPAVYTVWKRSSMGFQGTDGFCVYDAEGSLAFRVDNYSRRPKLCTGELLLMDGRGTPLLSLRPQILSLHDRWNCYTTTEESPVGKQQPASTPQLVFTMHKRAALQSSDQAEVHMASASSSAAGGAASSGSGLSCKHHQAAAAPSFRIEGSFSRRNCKIVRGSDGRNVARISAKKVGVPSSGPAVVTTLADDVFSLVVRPGVDAATIMAMVVVMDRICRRPYTPMVCSSE